MAIQTNSQHRMFSFRDQRVGVTYLIFTIVFVFTVGVLWGHMDGILKEDTYRLMAKAGLLLVPVVAFICNTWELFVDDQSVKRKHQSHPKVIRLANWCMFAAWALMVADVVHAGALLKFEQSSKNQEKVAQLVTDSQAKIAGETTKAAIQSSSEQAQKMNANGQRRTAQAQLRAGKEIAAGANEAARKGATKAIEEAKPSTFLADWYINGGMYVALPLLALFIFGITMLLAKQAAPYVDLDDDGKPDIEQGNAEQPQRPEVPTYNHGAGDGTLYSFSPEGVLQRVDHGVTQAEARRRAQVDAAREIGERRLNNGQQPIPQPTLARPATRLSRIIRRLANRPK
jgi:hypothetical protein